MSTYLGQRVPTPALQIYARLPMVLCARHCIVKVSIAKLDVRCIVRTCKVEEGLKKNPLGACKTPSKFSVFHLLFRRIQQSPHFKIKD